MTASPSTTTVSLTHVEAAHLAAEVLETLTDAGVRCHSIQATDPSLEGSVFGCIDIHVTTADDVDRAAEILEMAEDCGTYDTLYSRAGRVRGVKVMAYSGRREAKS